MAAVPFAGTLNFKGMSNGEGLQYRFTATDVNAAYWVFDDGNSFLQLPPTQKWVLIDCQIETGGTDTTNDTVYINQKPAFTLSRKSNLTTAIGRAFQVMPAGFPAGAMVRFKQNT